MRSRWRAPSSNRPASATRVNAAGRPPRDSPTPAGRSRSWRSSPQLPIVALLRWRASRGARNPTGDRDACGGRSVVVRDLSRRPQRGVPGRTGPAAALASTARSTRGAATGGHRWRGIPVLVAGQRLDRRSAPVASLKRIDLASGLVRTLANRPSAGGTWSVDGTILIGSVIGPHPPRSMQTAGTVAANDQPAGRAEQSPLAAVPAGWLRFLFFTLGAPDVAGVYLGSTASGEREASIGQGIGLPLHAARLTCCSHDKGGCGHGDWAAIPRLSTENWCLLRRRCSCLRGFFGYSAFSSSSTGSIAYRASAGETQLVWLDRAGRPVGTVGRADDGQMTLYQLSRDGRVAAVTRTIAGSTNVWLVDTERGVPRRLTFDVNDNDVILSPDGTRVVHQANGPRDGSVVYQRSFGWHRRRDSAARRIGRRMASPAGLVCRRTLHRVRGNHDDGLRSARAARSLANGHRSTSRGHPSQRLNARFSPDSRWVALRVDRNRTESRSTCSPSRAPGPKVQVSVGGGTMPRWRRDGSELFYLAPDRRLMAVSIVATRRAARGGSSASLVHAVHDDQAYEPSPDGKPVSGHRGRVGGQPDLRDPQLEAAGTLTASLASTRACPVPERRETEQQVRAPAALTGARCSRSRRASRPEAR